MKIRISRFLTIITTSVITLQLTGCALLSPPDLPTDLSPTPSFDVITSGKDDSCPVWMYRNKTFYHSANIERPFVYVNEQKIGELGVSDSMCLNLSAGRYQISMRESFLFMPAETSNVLIVEPEIGKTIYVRYSKEITRFSYPESNLFLVDRQSWLERK